MELLQYKHLARNTQAYTTSIRLLIREFQGLFKLLVKNLILSITTIVVDSLRIGEIVTLNGKNSISRLDSRRLLPV